MPRFNTMLRRACSLTCIGLIATACAGPGFYRTSNATVTPVATVRAITAPVTANGEEELYQLQRTAGRDAAALRRSWILLQTKRVEAARKSLDQILFRADAPPPAIEALARYVRASVFLAEGDSARAKGDLDRAERTALDPSLRSRIASARKQLTPAPTRSASPAPATSSRVLKRARWSPASARPSGMDPMGRVWRLTVHHSAVHTRGASETAAAQAMRSIQSTHMDLWKFDDIGYHYIIDSVGRIWTARDVRYQGAHARGKNNRGNVGICLLGNFVKGPNGEQPSKSQVSALVTLIAQLRSRYQIAADQILTHGELVATECPGANLQAIVDRLRSRTSPVTLRGKD